jgi:enamine deaminase RidA (YjgF/YER057c/UK114 family)
LPPRQRPEAGESPYEQTKAAIEKIRLALAPASLSLDDVVRTRMFVTAGGDRSERVSRKYVTRLT